MTTRDFITWVLLWISVLSWGLWVGGTTYQTLVIVPAWKAAPAEAFRTFLTVTNFSHNVLRFFGPRWMPVRVLPVLCLLFSGWNLQAHRPFLAIAAACVVVGVVFTLAYVYPINRILIDQAGGTLTEDELRAMIRTWVIADRARLLVVSVGYLALLRAFSMSMPTQGH